MSNNLKELSQDSQIQLYEDQHGQIILDVHFRNNDLWLSLGQISTLFARDKAVISRHLKNIFQEKELDKISTVAFFATVQNEGERTIERAIEHFNLDAILSVGYRVNSKQGTQFRKWATSVLQNHLIDGYTLNQNRITSQKIEQLEHTIRLLSNTLTHGNLVSEMGSRK